MTYIQDLTETNPEFPIRNIETPEGDDDRELDRLREKEYENGTDKDIAKS